MDIERMMAMSPERLRAYRDENKNKLTEEERKLIVDRLYYFYKANKKFLRHMMKSQVIKAGVKLLELEEKGKPVFKDGQIVGLEYDVFEALIKVVDVAQARSKRRGNKNSERKVNKRDGGNGKI